MKLILASESPRRRELLRQIGLEFQVLSCGGEEKVTVREPQKVVEEHAIQKAMATAEFLKKQSLESEDYQKNKKMVNIDMDESFAVIGADTVVAFENQILEKPKNEEEAVRMLSKLQGNTHQVYTGICIVGKNAKGEKKRMVFHECTQVTFYEISKEEILAYTATKEPMDKAGSYGIQGMGAKFVKSICGDYNNVVGLPVAKLYQQLKDWEK